MSKEQRLAAPHNSAATQNPKAGPIATVLLTAVAFFMVVLDALVVVTALPSIHRSLGGSVDSLQWTISAYNLAFGSGIITAAALGERLGRRKMYVAGLALFTLSSAMCAIAPGLGLLIAARAAQGLGAAIIAPLSLTILTSAFPPERRGTIIGLWGGISGLGVAAGPLIGGAVTQGLSWHWVFWVNVPIGIAAVIGAWLRLPESRGVRVRLDIVGLVLVSIGASALIWALVEGSSKGWTSTLVITVALMGTFALAAFLIWESRTEAPMIPLGLFRNVSFTAAVASTFLMGAAIYAAAFLTSQYFQFAFHDSPLAAGVRFLPWTATPLVVAPLAGAISDRVGARALIVPGLILQGAGFAWILVLAGTHAGYATYLPAFIIAGIGVSMAIPTAPAAALTAVPEAVLGKASAIVTSLRQFGAVVGIAIVTAVFNANGSLNSPADVTSGYRPGLTTAAALSVLGAITALAIRRTAARGSAGPVGPAEPAGSASAEPHQNPALPLTEGVGSSHA